MGIAASTAAWTRWPTLSEPVPYGMCFTSPCWLNRLSVNWVCSGATIHAGKASSMKLRTEAKASLEVSAPPVMAWTCAQSTMGRTNGKLAGEDGDVAQRAKRSIVPAGLEAKTNAESLDLWGHVLQPGADPVHQLIGRPLVGVAEVGADHRSTKRPPQLHGVLEGSEALFGLVLLLNGENGEIGGMDREPDVPLRSQFAETGAPLLLPGEAGDEGKLQCPVTPRRHIVEKRLVIGPLGRDPRNAKPDLSIVCHERTSVV